MSTKFSAKEDQQYAKWKPGKGQFTTTFTDTPELAIEDVKRLREKLGVAHVRLKTLAKRLQEANRRYWELKRDVVGVPPPAWYRAKLSALSSAINRLLSLIKEPSGTAFIALNLRLFANKDRPLRAGLITQSCGESYEQILERLKQACEQVEYPHATAWHVRSPTSVKGAKKKLHIIEAATELRQIWIDFTGKQFSMNFNAGQHIITKVDGTTVAKDGLSKAFYAAGPLFVQSAMHLIDPAVTATQITSAFRALPKSKPVRKRKAVIDRT